MSGCPVIPPFPALRELTDVSLVIHTADQPGGLARLLESIVASGFRGPILVADDASRPCREEILRRFGDHVANYQVLPANSGTSVARNALLDRVETPYFVLLEDDLLFDERTHLGLMRDIVVHSEVDLVGACTYDRIHDRVDRWLWEVPWFRHKLPRLRREVPSTRFGNFDPGEPPGIAPVPEPHRPPWIRCDFVPDFFLADVASLRNRGIRWDETPRHDEEPLAFFREARSRGLTVAMTQEAGIVRLGLSNGFRRSGGETIRKA